MDEFYSAVDTRDQIATKSEQQFLELSSHVYTQIMRPQVAQDA